MRFRAADDYVSLIAELFDKMRDENLAASEWTLMKNALSQFAAASVIEHLGASGISTTATRLFEASRALCCANPGLGGQLTITVVAAGKEREHWDAMLHIRNGPAQDCFTALPMPAMASR